MDILNALTVLINFTVIPALAYGSQLALGAIFVTLIYAVLRFANFATGDMMSFGTMFAVLLTYYFQTIGINFGFLDFSNKCMHMLSISDGTYFFGVQLCIKTSIFNEKSDFCYGLGTSLNYTLWQFCRPGGLCLASLRSKQHIPPLLPISVD